MKKILVTGGAGFIGSNLISTLLKKNYKVVTLDNLSTGSLQNLVELQDHPSFTFVKGDILDYSIVQELTAEVDAVSHQAALGSVPRSISDPLLSNKVNVEGTLNVFKACVDNKVDRVVYAASSSTYGDSHELPKIEERIGKPLSPYAVTKLINELYAEVFHKVYGLNTIGLRYFNVFGPKQNPKGPYAAVIPLFIQSILSGQPPIINGDGKHSRDFTYVANAVKANILALEAPASSFNKVYNIACGQRTTLNELFDSLKTISGSELNPIYGPERQGDVKDSLAEISRANEFLKYSPDVDIDQGLLRTFQWYRDNVDSISK